MWIRCASEQRERRIEVRRRDRRCSRVTPDCRAPICTSGGKHAEERVRRAISATYQHKTNAGASSVVSRISVAAGLTGPQHLATNVAIPSLTAGSSGLYFLPDRVLLRDGKHYTDISYRHLRAHGYRPRFIESPGRLPNDAQQVGQTWQYVNVKGGPDRRFANNPILPVMMYGNVDLSSPHGLDWRLQTSQADAAIVIANTLAAVPLIADAN